jgi:hypothetical protein
MINPWISSTHSRNGVMEVVNNYNRTIKRMYSTLVSTKNFAIEGRAK